jgi:uncharacterized peroxidase-related enzyme
LLALAGRSAVEAEALVHVLAEDFRRADVTPADRAMLDYVGKLTRDPAAITERDVRELRDAGFDDRGIHDICAVAAYYAFVNRIADGLGVELEPRFDGAAG